MCSVNILYWSYAAEDSNDASIPVSGCCACTQKEDFGSDGCFHQEEKHKGSYLIPRSKQRAKISQMLWDHSGCNGIYMHVNTRGLIYCSRKLSITHRVEDNCQYVIIRDHQRFEGNYMDFLWTNKNKRIRIKGMSNEGKNTKKRKKKPRKSRTKKINVDTTKLKESKVVISKGIDSGISIDHVKKNVEEESNETNEEIEDMEEEMEEEEQRKSIDKHSNRKVKKLPKKLRYLFSDAYVKPRHSKKYNQEMDCLLTEFSCSRSIQVISQLPASQSQLYDDSDEIVCSQEITFGSFFTVKDLADLCLDSTFCTIKRHESRNNKETTIVSRNITGVNDNKKKEYENVLTEKQFSTATICTHIEENIISKVKNCSNHNAMIDDDDSNIIVILPHLPLRPDNLMSEFKENYKEVLCKKRRFLLNISHLAHQHLVRMNSLPYDIMSNSGITMFLVFVYIKKIDNDTDMYKLWINSNLSDIKLQDAFYEPVQKKFTSIHEIIHKALDVFQDPNLNQTLMSKNYLKNNYFVQLPSCNFHLLRYMRSKRKLSNSQSNQEQIQRQKQMSDSRFSERSHIDISLLNDSMNTQTIMKKGPSESSICGLCLQKFNERNIFPMALLVCSHWFCEGCWKFKLYAQMKEKNHKSIYCIERGCNATVDLVTLISIIDVQSLEKFNNIKKMKMFHNNVLCCSNASCQKPLFLEKYDVEKCKSDQFIPVICSCSQQYCSKCFDFPHWPVNCDISNVYNKCLEAQGHSFDRCLADDELPDLLLRGKSCPQCGIFIQGKTNQSKIEQCVCGCSFCWPCGKVCDHGKNEHSFCVERFELSDKKLKEKVIKRTSLDISDNQGRRWYTVALNHRQMRHPQVVRSLYEMADQIIERVSKVSKSGKHIGDVKSAAVGWKSILRKWNQKMCRRLKKVNAVDSNKPVYISDSSSSRSLSFSDCTDLDSKHSEAKSPPMSPALLPSHTVVKSASSSCIAKAVCNIVQVKLEIHHIIEHLAVMLEFDHSLKQSGSTGKIIRSLERGEDLCESLGLLLQNCHNENTPRIIPTFLRLRLQASNMLMTLHHHLESI